MGQDSLQSLLADHLVNDTLTTDSLQTDSLQADSLSTGPSIADLDVFRPEGRIMTYGKWIREHFERSPAFITTLYVIIAYSILTLVVLLTIILANRNKMERDAELREFLLENYQRLLMDYLFDEENRETSMDELDRIAHNRVRRQVLIDEMIDLSMNLKGGVKQQIQELYLELGLKRDSLSKAYSRHWHNNVKGFRELAFIGIRDANEQIVKALNHRNPIVRMEAQIAMVNLSDEHPYEFLDILEQPFSLWEQVTLHEMLIQHDLKVPAFHSWFHSENLTVLRFAIEMAAFYKQEEVAEELYRLFEHEEESIRQAAYRACGDIGLGSSLSLLQGRYEEESYLNKLTILNTFVRVPDEHFLGFLKSVLDTEEDVQLQIRATKAMENTDEPGISMLIKLMKSKSEYKNYQIIIRHVLDGRIY